MSLSIEKGEIFGFLGPNGGGKTTLFKILSTYFYFESGSVKIFDLDLRENPESVRKWMGVVFQSASIDKKLTVGENMEHQGHLYGISGKNLKQRVQELLSRVALQDRMPDRAETLSGGLQRRLEIAKGMIHSPQLLLMDEPSTGLDPGARRDLWDYLKELQSEGMTILVTTHLMEEAEKCDRLAILNQGELVALGTPAKLKEEIGGDVITIEARDVSVLAQQIQKKFALEPAVFDRVLRIERKNGHEFVPQLVTAFPGEILSITVGKPTLEDVFIHRTGHRFWKKEAE